MKKLIATLAVSTALVAAPAYAQLFEDWDTDNDGFLSSAEFQPGLESEGWFSDWNTNDDGLLAEDEFETGLFGVFDDDDDGALTSAEWDEGIDAWYGENTVDLTFSNWDDDGDGVLGEEEFTEALGSTGIYDSFAGYDREVSESEFDEGLFNWFEEDDDALLAEDEWDPLFGLLD